MRLWGVIVGKGERGFFRRWGWGGPSLVLEGRKGDWLMGVGKSNSKGKNRRALVCPTLPKEGRVGHPDWLWGWGWATRLSF